MFEEEAKSFGKRVEMDEKFQPMLSWDCGYREGMEIGFQKGGDKEVEISLDVSESEKDFDHRLFRILVN